MNLQEIASALSITAGAVTSHIRILEQAGLIHVENRSGIKGMQKICTLPEKRFVLQLPGQDEQNRRLRLDIPIGSYVNYEASPTCGIVTPTEILGSFDQPVYFDDPMRGQAALLWFQNGFLEYRIPNYLQESQLLDELRITQEICSEVPAPAYRDSWPSDIYFSLNDITLGFWTTPKDYISPHGIYTPSWWPDNYSQYGDRVTLSVTSQGSFLNGQPVSSVSLKDLMLCPGQSFIYRISMPRAAAHQGGLTLFGHGFGNYAGNLRVDLFYHTSRTYMQKKARSS